MFNIFTLNLHPFMDAEGDVGGGTVTPQTTEETTGEAQTGSVTGAEGTSQTVTDPASQKPAQTPEQNAAFAEMRRKSEAAERRAQEVEQARQRDINIAKKYGKDYDVYSEADIAEKYGDQGIKTLADMEAAIQAEQYRQKGIDPDVINKIIEEHPAIKQAKKQEQDRFLVDSFNDLSKEYPDITKVEDVPDEVWKKWNGGSTGLSLVEAFYLVNRKEIITKQTDAAKQATLNNIQGKEHVRGNGKGTEVDTTRIPDDVLEMYKKFNPGKTMDEYKAHYKKSLGK